MEFLQYNYTAAGTYEIIVSIYRARRWRWSSARLQVVDQIRVWGLGDLQYSMWGLHAPWNRIGIKNKRFRLRFRVEDRTGENYVQASAF
jgi:hypothetical protein